MIGFDALGMLAPFAAWRRPSSLPAYPWLARRGIIRRSGYSSLGARRMPELSPRELAVRFTDQESYFVSEASVYRLLKSRDLLPSPAFIQIKAAEEFHTKTTAPNQLWQTDFTFLKVIGWGWFYLCTVLDDFSRYVISWRLCTGMTASDVSETLELAMTASGCRDVPLRQRPRLSGVSTYGTKLAI